MSKIKVILFFIAGLFFGSFIHASPTSNAFIPCKKLAVATLKYCLKDDDDTCWTKSKANYNSCRKEVLQGYVSDHERVSEKKKLRDKIDRKKTGNID